MSIVAPNKRLPSNCFVILINVIDWDCEWISWCVTSVIFWHYCDTFRVVAIREHVLRGQCAFFSLFVCAIVNCELRFCVHRLLTQRQFGYFSCAHRLNRLHESRWINRWPNNYWNTEMESARCRSAGPFQCQVLATKNTSKSFSDGNFQPVISWIQLLIWFSLLWRRCKLLVVGGGTGGCTIAAKFAPSMGKNQCIVLEPAERHYYQPMFTMIGGGMEHFPESYRAMKSVLPAKAKWMRDAAVKFEPNENRVYTKHGHEISYDLLVVATGLQLNYDKVGPFRMHTCVRWICIHIVFNLTQIPGLREALAIPHGNVTSIYSPKYVNRHMQALENFEKGNIVFTFPASPVKCPGAPQKICYITEHYLRRVNKRQNAKIIYNTALPVIFGVKYFADALWKVVNERNIDVNLKTNLVEVLPDKNIAVFANVDKPSERHNVEVSRATSDHHYYYYFYWIGRWYI